MRKRSDQFLQRKNGPFAKGKSEQVRLSNEIRASAAESSTRRRLRKAKQVLLKVARVPAVLSLVLNRRSLGSERRRNRLTQGPPRMVRYAFLFFLVYAVSTVILWFGNWSWLENILASIVGNALHFPVLENQIAVGNDFFAITESCTGLASLSVWLAVVLPLKQPKGKTKLIWMVAGGIGLLIANVLRLLVVLQSAQWFGAEFAQWVHLASWFAMSALIILFWFFALKRAGIPTAEAF